MRIRRQWGSDWRKKRDDAIGEYYMRENKRLQNNPTAAVPEDMKQRMIDFIEQYFEQNGENDISNT